MSTAAALEAENLKINKDKPSVKYDEEEDGEFTDDADPSIGERLNYSLHPLETTWKLWFDNGAAKTKATMLPIHYFSTVEDFWSLYNNINSPSKFPVNSDVYCFKEKIEPNWEDPLCANGGKWTVVFPKGKSDTAWLYTLLALIGDQFDHGEEICGAVVNVRGRQEKVSIWTKNASNEIVQEDAKRDRIARNKYTV